MQHYDCFKTAVITGTTLHTGVIAHYAHHENNDIR